MFKISHSKLKNWRRCHRLYHYKYEEHLEPKAKGKTLLFGTIGHEMIEAEANGQDPWKVLKKYEGQYAKLFKEEREEYGDIIGDMKRLMVGYFNYWRTAMPVKWVKINGKFAEHEFEVEVSKGILLKGKIDGVGITIKNKLTWLNEHKFPKQFRQDDMESLTNVQTALYTHPKITASLGLKHVDGVMWTFTRQKGPTVPKLNKDGSLPKGDIDTLPHRGLERASSTSGDQLVNRIAARRRGRRCGRSRPGRRRLNHAPAVRGALGNRAIRPAPEAIDRHSDADAHRVVDG